MKQAERASIMRIVSDLIEADGIIDTRELLFLDSLREKYGIKKRMKFLLPHIPLQTLLMNYRSLMIALSMI